MRNFARAATGAATTLFIRSCGRVKQQKVEQSSLPKRGESQRRMTSKGLVGSTVVR